MLIQQKIGNISTHPSNGKVMDWVVLEWHETAKRILHKKTKSGIEISMRFLGENQQLTQGDILYENDESLIVVEVQPCEVIVISPKSQYGMASICYEIGNRHLPLFFENGQLLIPFDLPLFNLFSRAGYEIVAEKRQLLNQLKTTVLPHLIKRDEIKLVTKINTQKIEAND